MSTDFYSDHVDMLHATNQKEAGRHSVISDTTIKREKDKGKFLLVYFENKPHAFLMTNSTQETACFVMELQIIKALKLR